MPLKLRSINAKSAPEAVGGYSQALETTNSIRRLYISGQIPMARGGAVPDSFAEQAKLVWANVLAQLEAADMTIGNLVKVTIFLSDRKIRARKPSSATRGFGRSRPRAYGYHCGHFRRSLAIGNRSYCRSVTGQMQAGGGSVARRDASQPALVTMALPAQAGGLWWSRSRYRRRPSRCRQPDSSGAVRPATPRQPATR